MVKYEQMSIQSTADAALVLREIVAIDSYRWSEKVAQLSLATPSHIRGVANPARPEFCGLGDRNLMCVLFNYGKGKADTEQRQAVSTITDGLPRDIGDGYINHASLTVRKLRLYASTSKGRRVPRCYSRRRVSMLSPAELERQLDVEIQRIAKIPELEERATAFRSMCNTLEINDALVMRELWRMVREKVENPYLPEDFRIRLVT